MGWASHARRARRFAHGRCYFSVAVVAVAALAGCGGGGGSSSSSKASGSFCSELSKDWSQLQSAMGQATQEYMNTQGPAADPTTVSQDLAQDQSAYQSAAATASSLASKAPTKLKNDLTTDTENTQQRLSTVAASFTAAAHGDPSQLGNLDPTQFDAGSTGCEWGSTGPDGKTSST